MISVIIPVYQNWEDTAACLDALEKQTAKNFQVLIADDGSPTPPPSAIQERKFARYLRYENAGYGANCNRAAKEAIAMGATHLLFLNSDTSFGPRFMETWIRKVAEMPDAILSPLIYWWRSPTRIWSSGGKLTIFTPFVRSSQAFDRVTEVDTVTGCAILVPATVWTSLGGFDSKYWMYFEDFDLTLRAKRKGIRTCVVPDAELKVLHRVSGSFRESGAWSKHYLMTTSSLIFIRSHFYGIRKVAGIALSFAHLGLTLLVSLPALPSAGRLRDALRRGFS